MFYPPKAFHAIAKETGLYYNSYMRLAGHCFNFANSFLCALLIFSVFSAVAADADPSPGTGNKSGLLGTPKELAQWQLDIAESSFALAKTDRNLTSLLSAYERLMLLYCMPDLAQTLQYKGFPLDPLCLKYMDAVFALDAENPVALCSRDGIDSRSCEDAYAAQETVPYSSSYPLWPPEEGGVSDVDFALDSQVDSAQIVALNAELSRLESRAAISPELKAEVAPRLRQVLSEIVSLNCKTVKMKIQTLFGPAGAASGVEIPQTALKDPQFRSYLQSLSPAQREEAIKKARQLEQDNARRNQQEAESPMDLLMKGFSPTPVSKNRVARIRSDGVTRTRYITPQCDGMITRVLRSEPGNAAAICARYGDFTPDCIRAKRRERAQSVRKLAPRKDAGGSQPATTQKPGNFSTF